MASRGLSQLYFSMILWHNPNKEKGREIAVADYNRGDTIMHQSGFRTTEWSGETDCKEPDLGHHGRLPRWWWWQDQEDEVRICQTKIRNQSQGLESCLSVEFWVTRNIAQHPCLDSLLHLYRSVCMGSSEMTEPNPNYFQLYPGSLY